MKPCLVPHQTLFARRWLGESGLIALLLSLVIPAPAQDRFDAKPFLNQRPIIGEVDEEGLGSVPLDSLFFRSTQQNFGDVRVLAGDRPVAYRIVEVPKGESAKSARAYPSEILGFRELPDKSIEILTRLIPEKVSVRRISLETPLRNFEKRVDVAGSNDGAAWVELIDDGLVFDHEKFIDLRRVSLDLPENSYRWFRIRIADATDTQRSLVRSIRRTVAESDGLSVETAEEVARRHFRVDRVALFSESREAVPDLSLEEYPLEPLSRSENAEKKRSEVLIDTGTAPVDTLRFVTSEKNFRRQIVVESSDSQEIPTEETVWRQIHSGAIHRFEIGEFSEEKLTLSWSPPSRTARPRWIRLLIRNGDSPAVPFDSIEGIGERYELRFLAEPGTEYVSYFGNGGTAIDPPEYDVSAISAAAAGPVAKIALGWGELKRNTAHSPGKSGGDPAQRKWVLWLAILAAVAGLIWALVRSAGKIESQTE